MRLPLLLLTLAALPAAAQTAPAGPALTPNSGAFTGEGVLNDHDGNRGTWSVQAALRGGNMTGSGTIAIAGVTLSLPLVPARSYFENGKCYFLFEAGRTHLNFSGPCTAKGTAGRWDGFIAENGVGSKTGEMQAAFRFGAAVARAPAAGVLPTQKLTCAWQERIGGNVAGDPARYELRYSNMVTLTLGPGGTYRTNAASGGFTRQGDAIRLTSGAFAGAVGRLRPDRSGTPAVYFEIDENRRANGVHIVDPRTTACTVARQ